MLYILFDKKSIGSGVNIQLEFNQQLAKQLHKPVMNGTEIYKFKAKDSETVATPLCLGNISKDWSADNMKEGV